MTKLTIYRTQNNATTEMLNQSNVEDVWGTHMLVKTIDASDKEAVAQAKAEDWHDNPQAVIDELEGVQLAKENKLLQNKIDIVESKNRIAELEQQIADKDAQIKTLQDQLAAQSAEKPTAEPEKPVEKPTKSAKSS